MLGRQPQTSDHRELLIDCRLLKLEFDRQKVIPCQPRTVLVNDNNREEYLTVHANATGGAARKGGASIQQGSDVVRHLLTQNLLAHGGHVLVGVNEHLDQPTGRS